MATYNIGASNMGWSQAGIRVGNITIPVLMLTIDAGTALNTGDYITFSSYILPPEGLVTQCCWAVSKFALSAWGVSITPGQQTWSDDYGSVILSHSESTKLWKSELRFNIGNTNYYLGNSGIQVAENDYWQYATYAYIVRDKNSDKIFFCAYGFPGITFNDSTTAVSDVGYNKFGIGNLDSISVITTPTTYTRDSSITMSLVSSIYTDAFFDHSIIIPPEPPVDPYAPGGYSGTGGGGGTFDLESDVIGLPPLPTLSFAATGFTRIYNPTLSQLNALANYLWTDQTFLDTVINHLKQLLENPMDAVISLSLLPCSIPNGSPEAVKVMYINTGVSMAPATTQFVDVDCGTYTIEEFYGSALDYNPYTKVHCYLPYIGQVTLDTDEVMGRTLNVVYRIDIVTGMCAAMILVDQNVLYQFSGHCAINMPINSADFSGYIGAAMTAGKMVAGVVAGASGNLPLAGELIGAPAPKVTSTSQTTETVKTRNPKTGRQVTQWSDTKARETTASGASFGEMTRKAISNSVGAVMGSKLTVEHAGGFTGNSGYLAVRRPYLIIERPRMCNPEEYGKYNGRPSMIYMNLGECVGYTEVQSIQFENIPATNPELAELSELLKSGVLF